MPMTNEYREALERAIIKAREDGRAVDARALETIREAIALDLLAEETLDEVAIGLREGSR